jgi:hypothetical protein
MGASKQRTKFQQSLQTCKCVSISRIFLNRSAWFLSMLTATFVFKINRRSPWGRKYTYYTKHLLNPPSLNSELHCTSLHNYEHPMTGIMTVISTRSFCVLGPWKLEARVYTPTRRMQCGCMENSNNHNTILYLHIDGQQLQHWDTITKIMYLLQ